MKIKGVSVRRLGSENDPNAEVVVEVQLEDGTQHELGREKLADNFSHWWNVLDLQE